MKFIPKKFFLAAIKKSLVDGASEKLNALLQEEDRKF